MISTVLARSASRGSIASMRRIAGDTPALSADGVPVTLRKFEVRSVSSGEDAQGEALVTVEHNGRTHRGSSVTTNIVESGVRAFIEKLEIPADAKQRLLALTPQGYTGMGAELARAFFLLRRIHPALALLIAAGLFTLTFAWNDFVVAVAMNSSDDVRTLPVAEACGSVRVAAILACLAGVVLLGLWQLWGRIAF